MKVDFGQVSNLNGNTVDDIPTDEGTVVVFTTNSVDADVYSQTAAALLVHSDAGDYWIVTGFEDYRTSEEVNSFLDLGDVDWKVVN